MRKFLQIINEASVRLSYEHEGFPTELHDASDIEKAVKGEHINHETMITVFRNGEKRPTLQPAADVPEVAKHLPEKAKAPKVTVTYEADGFPHELVTSTDVKKALQKGDLTADTPVNVYRRGEDRPTAMKAAEVPELASFFGKKKEEAPKERQVLTVTSTLETIRSADIRTEEGAQQMLDALHRLVMSVDHFVGYDVSMKGEMNKAISRAEEMFPRDIEHLMGDEQAMRKIKNGLSLIRAALSKQNIVMESADGGQDWYERRHELRPDMVFKDHEGHLVMLDRQVPGDATQWYVATWWGNSWAYMDTVIEPSDLKELVPDPETLKEGMDWDEYDDDRYDDRPREFEDGARVRYTDMAGRDRGVGTVTNFTTARDAGKMDDVYSVKLDSDAGTDTSVWGYPRQLRRA